MTIINFVWNPHSNHKLRFPWYLTQLGLLIFPIIPSLGAISFVIASVITWRQKYRTIINRPLNWGFVLLSILFIATVALADDKVAALLGLFNFLPFFLFFATISALIQTTAQLRQLSWILVINSIPVVFVGLGHMFLNWSTPQFYEIILGWYLREGMTSSNRMSSVMMNSNLLAAYTLTVLVLGLGLWIENWQKICKNYSNNQNFNNAKFNFSSFPIPFIFLTVIILGDFIALMLTHSRNGWGNAMFIIISYAFYQSWHWILGLISAVSASVMMAARGPSSIAEFFRSFIPQFFWVRLQNHVYSHAPLPIHRKTQWEFAWSLTLERPWSGWGLRNFSLLYQTQTQHWMGHPHNLFLMLSAETGLPATILFFGLFAWLFIEGFRLLRDSTFRHGGDKLIFFSYLLTFVTWMIFNTVDVTVFDFRLNTLFWLILAAVCGVTYRCKQNKQSQYLNSSFLAEDYLLIQTELR